MASSTIDLRSDTVTRPTAAMRAAMAAAEVGDDVLGDDPTVIALQDKVAKLLGKEAACFVPTGTMANQTAIRAHTEPGDEVLAHEDSHIIHYETGAPAALSGVMIRPIRGEFGLFDVDDFESLVRPMSFHFARSRLLLVENTHNRGGGSVWPLEQTNRVARRARELGLRTHLDGARLWNACIATGCAPADYAAPFDTVSCCFSKGLGAPAGSAVAGDLGTISRVHRFRKMFGGTMRQSGILAAACIHALDHHMARLHDDHENAARLAAGLSKVPGIRVEPAQVRTNMVFFTLQTGMPNAAEFCRAMEAHGVRALPNAPRRVRMVCHLDVTPTDIDRAIHTIARLASPAMV
jgi:threonine aldolase